MTIPEAHPPAEYPGPAAGEQLERIEAKLDRLLGLLELAMTLVPYPMRLRLQKGKRDVH